MPIPLLLPSFCLNDSADGTPHPLWGAMDGDQKLFKSHCARFELGVFYDVRTFRIGETFEKHKSGRVPRLFEDF